MRNSWRLFLTGVLLIVAGCTLAYLTQTSGGIRVLDVRFTGSNATPMSALLYVPPHATSKTPAPGILAVHGYINSRETQSGFAIEYARRGYVVLALDQTGHGYSGGSAFSNGFGGPDGLKYLRSLDIVDVNNIGLEGHSMGGGAILAAAHAYPEGYRSMVLEGSAPGTAFSPPGNLDFPRNLAVVYSQYDEFGQLMWNVARAKDVVQSAKLLKLFGVDSKVIPQKIYGSIAQGNARVLYTPATTHPGDHISTTAIGDSLEWFGKTLSGGTPLSRDDQIWPRKEIGTLLAFIGFVILMLGTFDVLLKLPYFAVLKQAPVAVSDRRDMKWWLSFAITALLPVVTFYYFMDLGAKWLPPSRFFPQSISNQLLVWALLNSAITLLLGIFLKQRKATTPLNWKPSLLIAIVTVAVGYTALSLADFFCTVDFRFWVVALKLPNVAQFKMCLCYVLPFTFCFVIFSRALLAFLPVKGESTLMQYTAGIGAMALGFLGFLIAEYSPLFIADHLWIPAQALNAIISIQFLPVMAIVAVINVYLWRRTSNYLPGGLVCGLFVTGYIVAGTATQFHG